MFNHRIHSKIFVSIVFIFSSFVLSLLYTSGTSKAADYFIPSDSSGSSLEFIDTDHYSVTIGANNITPNITPEERGEPIRLVGNLERQSVGSNVFRGRVTNGNCTGMASITLQDGGFAGRNAPLSVEGFDCTGSGVDTIVSDFKFTGTNSDFDGTSGRAIVDPGSAMTCNANYGLSWLSCTLLENLLAVSKAGYDFISQLLVFRSNMIKTEGTTPQETVVYRYWVTFRNIANLVLLVGLVAVIFSQATSVGLSAYGVKKLLPRILALAILINLSFFMSQVLVDLSNIVGSNLVTLGDSMIDGANNTDTSPSDDAWRGTAELITMGGDMTTIVAGGVSAALAGPILLPMVSAMALPIMVVAFLAVLVALVVLIARQIIIVGMIILAPVAIAAAALPGTKKFYEFWKNTFASMLFMFPIIALLFAGSRIVASIVAQMSFFAVSGTITEAVLAPINNLTVIIVLVAPFFAIPFVVKTSGGMLGKLTGVMDKFTTGKARDAAKERYGQAKTNRDNEYVSNLDNKKRFNPRAAMARSKIKRTERYRSNEEAAKIASANIAAKQVLDPKSGADSAQRARAQAVRNEIESKEAEMELKFVYNGDASKMLADGIEKGNQSFINSAAAKLIGESRVDELQKQMGKMSKEQLQATTSTIFNDGAQFSKVKDQDIGFSRALADASQAKYKTGTKTVLNPATGKTEEQDVFDDNAGNGLSGKQFMGHFNDDKSTNYYDQGAMGAKSSALAGQETFALTRQKGNGSLDSARATKAVAELYTDRGEYKQPQKEILKTAAGLGNPHNDF